MFQIFLIPKFVLNISKIEVFFEHPVTLIEEAIIEWALRVHFKGTF